MPSEPSLIAVVGATGTGKSRLALDLAGRLRDAGRAAEIVNADSMQLYRGMDIGTAKVPPTGRDGIPHHLIDVLDPTDEASVARYQRDARGAIDGILERGGVPILVGGSGLYVFAVLYDYRFPGTDPDLRSALERELLDRGTGALFARLRATDPAAAAAIGPQNGRRLVRALEVGALTGQPFRAGVAPDDHPWRAAVPIGLRVDRAQLVHRLDDRAAGMWRAGLLDEVRQLRDSGLGTTASQAIGYAQALAQLDGRIDQAAAIAETAALTRRYARRQVSWFRRSASTSWLDADDPDLVVRALAITSILG